jgi:hypothetical protein
MLLLQSPTKLERKGVQETSLLRSNVVFAAAGDWRRVTR